MTQPVSAPEKTLEHWASLCIAYRYRSHAAQWWPVNGVDIDIQSLPTQPGKAIQLELKTTTPADSDPRLHDVKIDLGQLWEYSHKPLGRQPFYVFPRPHWDGELAAAARAHGREVTELAVPRSGRDWWFGDWMVVLTTQQVADVLRADLDAHGKPKRGPKKRLVRFDINDLESPVWGDPASSVPPSEVLGWSSFWSELDECGRDDWPQLIRLPKLVLARLRRTGPQAGDSYSRDEIVRMFQQSADLGADLQADYRELETLEPDGNGNFRVEPDNSSDTDGSEPGDDDAGGEPEDRRQVVFIDSRRLFPTER
jgi:hypothetical protein